MLDFPRIFSFPFSTRVHVYEVESFIKRLLIVETIRWMQPGNMEKEKSNQAHWTYVLCWKTRCDWVIRSAAFLDIPAQAKKTLKTNERVVAINEFGFEEYYIIQHLHTAWIDNDCI